MPELTLLIGLGLLAAAIALIFIEAFVPSGGLISLIAAACGVAGVVVLFRVSTGWGVTGLLMVLVLGPTAFFAALNMLPNTPFGRHMILGESEEERATRDRENAERDRAETSLIGSEGTAQTDLRPSGIVMIDDEPHDAFAEHGLIARGARVRVTSLEFGQLRVQELDTEDADDAVPPDQLG